MIRVIELTLTILKIQYKDGLIILTLSNQRVIPIYLFSFHYWTTYSKIIFDCSTSSSYIQIAFNEYLSDRLWIYIAYCFLMKSCYNGDKYFAIQLFVWFILLHLGWFEERMRCGYECKYVVYLIWFRIIEVVSRSGKMRLLLFGYILCS